MKIRTSLLMTILALCLPVSVFAYTSPGKPTGFVNDFAHVLSASDISTLETQLNTLRESTSAEVAVVTIPSLGDETIETYAVALFEEWGIGQKDKDNGLLILVAPNEHKVRIEVGYGLEGSVTDLQSGNIIRLEMLPAFKENNYALGISNGVKAVSEIITKSPEAEIYSKTDSNPFARLKINPEVILIILFVLVNFFARILGKTKSWWLGGVIGAAIGVIIAMIWGFFVIGLVAIIILVIAGLIFDFIVSKHPPSGTSGGIWPIFFGGGKGSSGGGGWSGGGGFGGGGSGGGGASGSW